MSMKRKIRNFRCTDALNDLLIEAANVVECPPSRLLREFVRQNSESIMNDPQIASEFRRKCAVS
jgi:hypothetical protein